MGRHPKLERRSPGGQLPPCLNRPGKWLMAADVANDELGLAGKLLDVLCVWPAECCSRVKRVEEAIEPQLHHIVKSNRMRAAT